jgi:hypothetical protein
MQQAEHGVAVGLGFGDHAYGEEIVDLLDRNTVGDEFLLNRKKPLDARLDACRDANLFKLCLQRADDAL